MKVEQDVIEILNQCHCEGNVLVLPGQLDRKSYEKVNKVLEAAGGKWNRFKKGHIFEDSAASIISKVIGDQSVVTQGDMDAYFTPQSVVDIIMDHADLRQGMEVLEPSAGTGNIAKEAAKFARVTCYEIQERYCKILRDSKLYKEVVCSDFLSVSSKAVFDRVLMNPPFTGQVDILHVIHALSFLKPGGKLITIMASGIVYRENQKSQHFRDMVMAHGGSIKILPQGSFSSSGTEVATCMVTLDA